MRLVYRAFNAILIAIDHKTIQTQALLMSLNYHKLINILDSL